MNDLSTRAANRSDLPSLSALWHEKAVLLAQQDRRFQLEGGARAAWEQAAGEWLENPACLLLILASGVRVVGYVIGWVQAAPPGITIRELGMITDLAVDVHEYHAGGARILVDAARRGFEARGVQQIVVSVPRRSVIEQAFWRAYGAAQWMEWLWIKS